MTWIVVAVLVVAIVVFGVAAVLYNRLVAVKHEVDRAWSNIDVLLKQRHDELPNLVATARAHMAHERDVLRMVMDSRAGVARALAALDVEALGPAEDRFRYGLGSFFAVAEAYPDLTADESFDRLRSRITLLEEQIADRRELYNATVASLNTRREHFRIPASPVLEFRDDGRMARTQPR
jgi:LemA protein